MTQSALKAVAAKAENVKNANNSPMVIDLVACFNEYFLLIAKEFALIINFTQERVYAKLVFCCSGFKNPCSISE